MDLYDTIWGRIPLTPEQAAGIRKMGFPAVYVGDGSAPPLTFSPIFTINDRAPGESGALTLTAEDIGALDQADLDALTTGTGRLSDVSLKAVFARPLWADARAYGLSGNGTDESASLQAAIDATAARRPSDATLAAAILYVPPGSYKVGAITVPSGVKLACDGVRFSPPTGSTGVQFTFTGTYAGISGAFLSGGYLAGCSAICLAPGSRWNTIDDCRFDGWGGRAIYDQGVANWITRILAMNCLQDAATLTTYTGVVELAGTDAWLHQAELTASRYPARGMSSSGFACALAITGANQMVESAVCETSDHGVYIGTGATQLNLVGVRGELCYGHGWVIAGGNGRIANPMALRNSQAGNLLYDGFHVTGGEFSITNATSYSAPPPAQQNIGILDTTVSMSNFNRWINPVDTGSNVDFFAGNNTGTTFAFPDGPPIPLTAGTSTPAVAGLTSVIASNTSDVTVSNFTKGVNGQRILIRGDGKTTLQHGATIQNTSGADLLLSPNTWYRYIRVAGVWAQLP